VQTAPVDCVILPRRTQSGFHHLIAISRRTYVITFIHYETDAEPGTLAVRLPIAVWFLLCHCNYNMAIVPAYALQNVTRDTVTVVHKKLSRNANISQVVDFLLQRACSSKVGKSAAIYPVHETLPLRKLL